MLPKDQCFQDINTIQQQSSCQLPCGSRKEFATYFTSLLLHLSCPSRSFIPALLRVVNCLPVKPVLDGVSDVALFHSPTCTDLKKPGLQCSGNFDDYKASG
jgi:hypothetical protein